MIEYLETVPTARQQHALLRAAHPDWSLDHRRRVRHAFMNTNWVASAYVDGTLAGVVRVITDGVSFGLIVDLLVHPQYRHQGIASTLLKMATVTHPEYYLYADAQYESLAPLYQQAGFTEHKLWRRLS